MGGTHTVIEHNGLSLSALQQTNFEQRDQAVVIKNTLNPDNPLAAF